MIANSIIDLIGNTPIMNLGKIKEKYNLKSNIYCKIEKNNPAGSIKDRAAYNMIKKGIEKGKINERTVFIEATSGNTGIALCAIGAYLGNKVILVMPETVSEERIKIARCYGAEVILTPAELGMKGSTSKAQELLEDIPNSYSLDQFNNPDNYECHYQTAEEIYRDFNGQIDYVFAGLGTGGTITGIGKYLKQIDSKIKIIAIEPEESPFITKGYAGSHKIQGIGANFIPSIVDFSSIDEVITVKSDDAIKTAQEVCMIEGLFVGISSGCSLKGMIDYIQKHELENKNCLCIFPDGGEKYLSTELAENFDFSDVSKKLNEKDEVIYKNIDRGEIIKLTNEVRKVLFPGYFEETKEDTLKYYDEKLIKISKILKKSLEDAGIKDASNLTQKFISKISEIKTLVNNDAFYVLECDPAAESIEEVILCYPGIYAISIYRMAHELYNLGVKQIPRVMTEFAHTKTGIDIHPGAIIGKNFFIDHGTGIVIGETTIIGDYVKIYQGVTLGALSLKDGKKLKGIKRHPTICNHVTIYAGASILGGETVIGENCIIGSNVYILKSIAPNKTVILSNQEINQIIK